MHGTRRVLVFCTLTTILPTMLLVIPLYLRHSFYANVAYAVTESDILEITDGISTIFCSKHTLQMNGTFNAFQMTQKPEITSSRKHIRLKKSLNLPDDTLEYWGFYLLKGATVALSVCSRFQGASILVVKGERNLRTCGMLEHTDNKQIAKGIFLPEAKRQVKITFESNAQEINSQETVPQHNKNVFHNIENDVSVEKTIDTNESFKNKTWKNGDGNIKEFSIGTNNSTEPNNEYPELEELIETAKTYVQKHISSSKKDINTTRRLRHAKNKHQQRIEVEEERNNILLQDKIRPRRNIDGKPAHKSRTKDEHNSLVQFLKLELNSESLDEDYPQGEQETDYEKVLNRRLKRSQELVKPPSLLDQGIKHGGNAGRNITDPKEASSVSSFENGLFNCYGGSILLTQEFQPSDQCTNVSYLLNGKHMQTRHNVVEDGYYYYIFYSDNDFVSNDIHALFDIYKPTFQYENVTKSCVNQTECSFKLGFLSPDRVIVEIPTRDGIEHEIDDVNLLISICHPRMGIYVIFPIAVLFFIITCAFM